MFPTGCICFLRESILPLFLRFCYSFIELCFYCNMTVAYFQLMIVFSAVFVIIDYKTGSSFSTLSL